MPNFTPLISTVDFTPTSFDDYMKPQVLAENLYQTRKKFLDDKADILANYLPYLNEATPEARKLYDDAQSQLERNVQLLGSKGWNLNPEPIIAFKNQYRNTNAILDKASKALDEQQKQDKEEKARDNSLFIRYKNKAGNFINPNIDSMITGDYSRHLVSGKEVQANAMADAQRLSSTVKAAFTEFKKNGQYVGYFSSKHGSMQGVPNAVLMDWLVAPEKYKEDIDSWLSNVKKFGGDHAVETMKTLFNGDFRDALQKVLDQTDYDNMETNDKLRLNNYLWTGAYQGMKYDEQLQESGSPFDWRMRTGGGGGSSQPGGAVQPVDLEDANNRAYVFVSNKKDSDSESTWNNAKRWFGIRDTDYGKTGQISMPALLATTRGGRQYHTGLIGSALMNTDDYTPADDFINGMSIEDLEKNGIYDYFSIWDDDDKLISKDKFIAKFSGKLDKRDNAYYLKHKANKDYGGLYKEKINGPRIGSAQTAEEIYDELRDATLAAYDVPEAEADKIKDDDSGKLFSKFIEDHNINKETLTAQILQMEDTYNNTERKLLVIPFASDNKQIVNNAISGFKIDNDGNEEDNAFRLKKVKGFKFEMKKDGKHLYTETEDLDDYTSTAVFGNDTNRSNVTFLLPADMSEGVIMQTDTGKWLLTPKELGSMYPKEEMQSSIDKINKEEKEIRALEKQKMELNTQCVLIAGNQELSDEEKEQQLAPLLSQLQAIEERRSARMQTVAIERSNVIKTFRYRFSLRQGTEQTGKQ